MLLFILLCFMPFDETGTYLAHYALIIIYS